MNEVLRREFPLTRPEAGVLLANGSIGAMIWGQDNILRITLNSADFWCHKGGLAPVASAAYPNIREYAARGDTAKLDGLLEQAKNGAGRLGRSTLLPLGRIECVFSKDTVFKTGYLHLKNGKVVIDIATDQGSRQVSCYCAMDKPLLNIHFPSGYDAPSITCVTAWEYSAETLEALGLERPVMIDELAIRGWIQKRPGDPPLCVGAVSDAGDIYIVMRYGDSAEAAKERVRKMLEKAKKTGSDPIRSASAAFWANHWRWVPHIELPSETLSFLYYYGTYLFASLTTPGGVVPTIFGPWIDEKSEPPLRGGYRAAINLSMCYWPAFRANLMHHCKSLFTMLDAWKERLRENARKQFGIEDGALLPAGVDDNCTRIDGTWTDLVDPGGACCVAELMYRYYLYTQDVEFLRTTAYPFMTAVMRVYEAMIEKRDGRFELPFSVSPSRKGSTGEQWGKNASFQLAAIHFLADSLIAAANALGEKPKHGWEEIRSSLPKAAMCETMTPDGGQRREFGVFDRRPLDESDALHSHLAAIFPFDTSDFGDAELSRALRGTIETWVSRGMGAWDATSFPWASIIHSRIENADMAELLLEIWERIFTNEGHAAVRDPLFMGFTTRSSPDSAIAGKNEILHVDSCMGAAAAIMEMLLHTRRGVNHLFSGAPRRWKYVSFDTIRTEGAFEVGATRRNGRVIRVSVKANAEGVFRLANPWSGKVTVQRAKGASVIQGPLLEVRLAADERVELTGE